MEIVDVHWTPKINVMHIKCSCRMMMEKPMNRWYIKCPWCGRSEHIDKLRNDFALKEKQNEN